LDNCDGDNIKVGGKNIKVWIKRKVRYVYKKFVYGRNNGSDCGNWYGENRLKI
jgi:hypothetical protein